MWAAVSGPRRAAANSLATLRRLAAVVTGSVAAVVFVSGCGDNLVPVDAPACGLSVAPYGTIDTFVSAHAVRTQDAAGKVTIAWLGALQAGPMGDTLDIQLIQGMGAFAGGPPAAGTYSLTGVESQLGTCGVCVVIETGMPREDFAAQSGTLVIEQIDTSFKASLSHVKLAHVTFDPATMMSTIVDGCRTSITAASWDTPIN